MRKSTHKFYGITELQFRGFMHLLGIKQPSLIHKGKKRKK